MSIASDAAHHHHHHHDLPWPASRRARLATVGGAIGVLVLNALGIVTNVFGVDTALIVAVLGGAPLAARAGKALLARQVNYDVTIAIAAAVAIAVGQYLAAGEVVLIVLIGDALEHWAMHRADRAIADLLSVQPDRATVLRDGREQSVPATDVQLSDRVLIRSGERIPVDGIVIDGQASVDQSLITGESVAAVKAPGADVYSGSVLEQGALDVRPVRVGADTTLARIGRVVAEAKRRRAPVVRTADRMSRMFLPVLLFSAVVVYLMTGEAIRSAAVLLVACSCALVYAAPAAFAAALARLGREGVLVKGGDVLERLSEITSVVFDKTGTLTAGHPSVAEVIAANSFTVDELLRLAAAAERRSEHALGRAVVAEAERRGLDVPTPESFVPSLGLGVIATVASREVQVGSVAFTVDRWAGSAGQIDDLVARSGRVTDMHVVVSVDGHVAGLIVLHDAPRPGAAAAIDALRKAGIREIFLLTGDDRRTADAVAASVGIDAEHVHAGLLPEGKLKRLGELTRAGDKMLVVGDGVNDAPALAAAHVGLAFGRGAADLSAEAAQVVALDARLEVVPELIVFARKTVARVRFNIMTFAVGVNCAAILAAGLGYLTPAGSAILHQIVSLIVILGSVSLLIEGRSIGAGRVLTESRARFLAGVERLRVAYGVPAATWIAGHRRTAVRAAVMVAALLWAASGLTRVGPGDSAVVQRFGRLVEGALEPGLHLRAPWPVETVTRLSPQRVRVLEIGFRTPANAPKGPTDYEWNTFHDEGQVQQVEGENLVLTGDENLSELYAVVHYAIAKPARYLFGVRDPEALVRMAAEGTLRGIAASYSLDTLLTTDRHPLEERWASALRDRLARLDAGIAVLAIHLTDVHPPVNVVEAFRDVASAQEEQMMKVNEAEAYSKEQIPMARGNAQARIEAASGYKASRISRSQGDASRFTARASPAGGASSLTMFRLQMETLEAVLPDKRVFITDDHTGGRRSWMFIGDGADALKVLTGQAGSEPASPPAREPQP